MYNFIYIYVCIIITVAHAHACILFCGPEEDYAMLACKGSNEQSS